MAFLVANPSLRWGKPSGGGTKSTNRKPVGVWVCSFIPLKSYRCSKCIVPGKPANTTILGTMTHYRVVLQIDFRPRRSFCRLAQLSRKPNNFLTWTL